MANLVVCCDGTWNTADQQEGGIPTPTNVVRLFNLVAEQNDKDGVEQKKYYHPGVGTDRRAWSTAFSAAASASASIATSRAAIAGCAATISARDLIFLFGFSRGAYTARSLGGLTTRFGLLDLTGIDRE